jgi:hypothetical protein
MCAQSMAVPMFTPIVIDLKTFMAFEPLILASRWVGFIVLVLEL